MNTEEKYKILLHKLQESKPVLQNPEEVTQDIMSKLKRKEDDTFTRIIIRLRPWISTAAIFLIGLFIYQQTEVPVEENRQNPIQVSESLPIRKECLQELKQEKPDRQSILRTYYCYREQIEQRSNTPIQRLIQLHNSL
jgi:hypothetical protein